MKQCRGLLHSAYLMAAADAYDISPFLVMNRQTNWMLITSRRTIERTS